MLHILKILVAHWLKIADAGYRLWVIRMCHCRFIICNKCTALARMWIIRGTVGGMWEISVPSFHSCYEPKMALRKSSVKKKGNRGEILYKEKLRK